MYSSGSIGVHVANGQGVRSGAVKPRLNHPGGGGVWPARWRRFRLWGLKSRSAADSSLKHPVDSHGADPVIAELHIRSETDAIVAGSDWVVPFVTFRQNPYITDKKG